MRHRNGRNNFSNSSKSTTNAQHQMIAPVTNVQPESTAQPSAPEHTTAEAQAARTPQTVDLEKENDTDDTASDEGTRPASGLITSETSDGPNAFDGSEGQRQDELLAEEEQEDSDEYPNINAEVKKDSKWHSRTSRQVYREVDPSDVVFLQEQNGNIKVVSRDALLDTYGEVSKKIRVTGPNGITEILKLEDGGFIVLANGGTTSYANKDVLKTAGYEV